MNGAQVMARTLLAGGVEVCFANPGTSEMHFVAALDSLPQIRCVLGLFEGVVTAAADGYARMAGKPAATLLHLGPGMANGMANLHNAKKARTSMINVVGDHATFHVGHETPLRSDIRTLAGPMSDWVGSARDAASVSALTAQAIRVARTRPGRIATLILPADAAWSDAPDTIEPVVASPEPQSCDPARLREAIEALRNGSKTVLFLAGPALLEPTLSQLGRIAAHTGCKLLSQLSTPRVQRGAGRIVVDRIPYPPEAGRKALAPYENVILIGAWPPVSFFGYPGQASELQAAGARIIDLGGPDSDVAGTIAALQEASGATHAQARIVSLAPPPLPAPGTLTPRAINQAVAALMPADAIVVDEAVTSVDGLLDLTASAPPHDWLRLTGGAIGIGLPLAAGAAVACPGRKVISLQADGSAMYTIQALWTQARERLDVVTVFYANRSYAILQGELRNVGGAEPGVNARRMMDLDDPVIDFVALARGLGVEGARAETVEQFTDLLRTAMRRKGPFVIEARI